jgi:hypothetical protein
MTTRRFAIISLVLLLSAHAVACSDDGGGDETNNPVADAGPDAADNDTGSEDAGQDANDASDLDAGDPEDASDTSDVTDPSDTGDVTPDVEADAGDVTPDVEPDTGEDVGPPPVDDIDPTGGAWSTNYSMPGLQGPSGARGYVMAEDKASGGFYVGGIFDVAGGASATNIAHWDGTQWNTVGSISLAIDVHALATTANGDLYAGGEGGGGGGIGIGGSNTLEKWDGSSWSVFANIGGGFGTVVYDIEVLSDGRIAIGGQFGDVDGQLLDNLAVWDGTSWSMLGNGDAPNGAVRVIEERANGDICIGGDFADIGSLTVNRIACYDGTQWNALGSGMNSSVEELLDDGNTLLAAGTFSVTDTSGNSSIGIGRWDGTAWDGVAGGVQGGSVTGVRALAHGPNGELFVGGTFTSAGSGTGQVGASNIAVLDANGTWSALGSGIFNTAGFVLGAVVGPNDFLVDDVNGTLTVAGLFSIVGDKFSLNIGQWDIGGTDDTSWSKVVGQGEFAGADIAVVTLATAPDDTVYAAGRFKTIGGKQISSLAQLTNTGWQEVPGAISGDIAEIVFDSNGHAYMGGSFTVASSTQNISNLAIWDGVDWSGFSAAVPGQITAMAIDANDTLYVAAHAPNANTSTVYEWTGSAWQQLGDAFDDYVQTMQVLPGGDLYAAGSFDGDITATTTLSKIARWDGSAWVGVGGGINEFGRISASTVWDGKLVVVGQFDEVGSAAAGSIAIWDGSTWDTLGGGLPSRFPNGPPPTVMAVTSKANGLFVSGTFPQIDTVPAKYVAWWDGQDWHALGDGLSDFAQALTVSDYRLFVGGPFTEAGGHPSYHIGEWDYSP